ncbi:MAG TPA: class I SAM-dependent methyltransferase [Candidatus Cybelea sp.]|jgi:SAM-dependent methyltransferase|nr:class I SAM-dependent methyltransferase [Candidatus Cybelea sp.]
MKSTERFGTRAKAYAAFRPTYPPAAIDAALDGLGDPKLLTIADVGAGTGISARLFADRGVSVIAIEPNAKMRSVAEPHASITWREGTGEHTGLADASVDAIVACQAFHWFATPEALREFRRVARRRAVVLQYERHERDEFTGAYGDIVRAYATDDTEELRRRALEFFAAFPGARVTQGEHGSRQRLDRDALLGRAASSSYLPSSGPRSESLQRDLHTLFDRHARDGHVDLVMVTYVLVADW